MIPTLILCGGRGSRISEHYPTVPKPMVPIGGRPILWHILNTYASYGHTDFVLALGWLGEEIRRYVLDYRAMVQDFRITLGKPEDIEYISPAPEQAWSIMCRDTGKDTSTGTRVRLALEGLPGDRFMVTYGDGVGNIDISELLDEHSKSGRLATVTAVQPPSRFGELIIDADGRVREFVEKPQTSSGAINGGFMVFEREAIDRYFPADGDYMLEREPLSNLARDGQLHAYVHRGFWQPMDTARERDLLELMWQSGRPPWKTWD